jgi:hypothetical protein
MYTIEHICALFPVITKTIISGLIGLIYPFKHYEVSSFLSHYELMEEG